MKKIIKIQILPKVTFTGTIGDITIFTHKLVLNLALLEWFGMRVYNQAYFMFVYILKYHYKNDKMRRLLFKLSTKTYKP